MQPPLRIACWLWALTLSAAGHAQSVKPESVGLSRERLERIDDFMQKHIEAGHVSGGVTLVARHGKIAHLQAHGVMDLQSGKPVEKNTLYRIASMSKPITALAVLMLVEEGKIRLNDPVSLYLPSFAKQVVAVPKGNSPQDGFDTVPVKRAITIKDLLTHTAGFQSGRYSTTPESTAAQQRRHELGLAWVEQLGAAPLDFQPGSSWAYSALAGFDVLSRIVEKTSGMTFDAFLQERIFKPLNMKDITFWPNEQQRARLASSYVASPNGLQPRPDPDSMSGERYFSGAGGLMTSAESYARFAMLLAQGGQLDGVRLLGKRTAEVMRSPHIPNTLIPDQPPIISAGDGFGFGVKVLTDPLATGTLLSEGAFGWFGFYGTYLIVAPKEELVAIMMVQTYLPGMSDEFETAVMQAITE
ncbi:MAG: beta-lactamase family protein [Nevskiaceae bacterium]|jgi:CubicO group peptidase (beta-lactamase class C family)|nr:beta-lactamase family protein [Nevskiaceae bacterium]